MGLASRFVVFLAVFAFALQTYAVQTHIHDAPRAVSNIVKIVTPHTPARHHKTPLENTPLTCPFCQSFALVGAVVTPTTLLLHLPLVWVESALLSLTVRATDVLPAHDWQTRAPPRR